MVCGNYGPVPVNSSPHTSWETHIRLGVLLRSGLWWSEGGLLCHRQITSWYVLGLQGHLNFVLGWLSVGPPSPPGLRIMMNSPMLSGGGGAVQVLWLTVLLSHNHSLESEGGTGYRQVCSLTLPSFQQSMNSSLVYREAPGKEVNFWTVSWNGQIHLM